MFRKNKNEIKKIDRITIENNPEQEIYRKTQKFVGTLRKKDTIVKDMLENKDSNIEKKEYKLKKLSKEEKIVNEFLSEAFNQSEKEEEILELSGQLNEKLKEQIIKQKLIDRKYTILRNFMILMVIAIIALSSFAWWGVLYGA